jgi:hypothetical protein
MVGLLKSTVSWHVLRWAATWAVVDRYWVAVLRAYLA